MATPASTAHPHDGLNGVRSAHLVRGSWNPSVGGWKATLGGLLTRVTGREQWREGLEGGPSLRQDCCHRAVVKPRTPGSKTSLAPPLVLDGGVWTAQQAPCHQWLMTPIVGTVVSGWNQAMRGLGAEQLGHPVSVSPAGPWPSPPALGLLRCPEDARPDLSFGHQGARGATSGSREGPADWG